MFVLLDLLQWFYGMGGVIGGRPLKTPSVPACSFPGFRQVTFKDQAPSGVPYTCNWRVRPHVERKCFPRNFMRLIERIFRRFGFPAFVIAGATCGLGAQGSSIALADFGVLRDGTFTTDVPTGGSYDPVSGLGSIVMSFGSPGQHQGIVFVDHELSEAINGFFNELGSVHGVAPAGVSWEIDEPGFSANPGDIYDHTLLGLLDNSVGKSDPDDVSMAIGWNFTLQPGETGSLSFFLGTEQPSGFHLRHLDPDSGESVFFSAALRIVPPLNSVPDDGGGTSLVAIAALALFARWRQARRC